MNKKTWLAVGLTAALIAAFVLWQSETKAPDQNSNTVPAETSSEKPEGNKETLPAPANNFNTWEGVLEKSNDTKKGNLMLKTTERTTYIFTSRDYSNLIGKNVVVTYQGDIESFTLGDITEK